MYYINEIYFYNLPGYQCSASRPSLSEWKVLEKTGKYRPSSLMFSHLASPSLLEDQASLVWEFPLPHALSHLSSFGLKVPLARLVVCHPCHKLASHSSFSVDLATMRKGYSLYPEQSGCHCKKRKGYSLKPKQSGRHYWKGIFFKTRTVRPPLCKRDIFVRAATVGFSFHKMQNPRWFCLS